MVPGARQQELPYLHHTKLSVAGKPQPCFCQATQPLRSRRIWAWPRAPLPCSLSCPQPASVLRQRTAGARCANMALDMAVRERNVLYTTAGDPVPSTSQTLGQVALAGALQGLRRL